jgi:hypothetical protein
MILAGSLDSKGECFLNSPASRHLLVELVPNLIDSDPTGMKLLLTDLQVALAHLDKEGTLGDSASHHTIRRHARRTYEEAVALLPRLIIRDDNRRYLQSRIALLKFRLAQSGEEF